MRKPPSHLPSSAPWALVTGASDGIGRAVAKRLAAAGYNLVICARRIGMLRELEQDLTTGAPCEVRVVAADLATSEGIARLDDETSDIPISCVVLAAGFGTSGPFLDNEIATEMRMVDLNCRAVVNATHRFAGRMRDSQLRGSIVLFSSLVAFQGVPRAANYAATKGFVQVLAEGLMHELAPHDISVLAVAPGPVNSGFAGVAGMVMGKAATPEEVADGVLAKLGANATIRPGFLSKALEYSLFALPRRGRTAIMKQVMAGMTQARS